MKVDGDRLWVPSGRYCVIIFLFAVSFFRKANVQLSATDPDFAICSPSLNCRFTFSVGKCRCFLGGPIVLKHQTDKIIQPLISDLISDRSSVCLTVHTLVTGTVV